MKPSRQTRLKLKKGFQAAPLRYEVLMVQQFTPEDIKIINKGLIIATTPVKAKALLPTVENRKSKWKLRQISLINSWDVQILTFKGLEVALFLKRQTSIIEPEPEDPAPEGVLEHSDDVWARLDLFSKSPRQLVGSVKQELADLHFEVFRLSKELEARERLHVLEIQNYERKLKKQGGSKDGKAEEEQGKDDRDAGHSRSKQACKEGREEA